MGRDLIRLADVPLVEHAGPGRVITDTLAVLECERAIAPAAIRASA